MRKRIYRAAIIKPIDLIMPQLQPNQNGIHEKICFIIAPIGDPDSEIRRISDIIFKHIIRPAVKSYGYKPIRADQISEPGLINNQVIRYLINSQLVISDLTGHDPNVFYELAIRHFLKKPLLQIIRKGEKLSKIIIP